MSVTIDPRGPPPRRLYQFPAREVTMELTLMDGEMLRRISPEEIKNGAWMDKAKKHELAPNILAMVQSFNRLALLVPAEILEEKTPQARAKVINAYIQIASKCYSLRNYNSLKAILAGLQCTPIYRLERTWKEVPSKQRKCFRKLSGVVSEENNWAAYRAELQQHLTLGSSCIPFLGAFLTTVVQQESYDKIRSKRPVDANCESMYTVLEAITVRHRLEKLTCKRSFDLPFGSSSDSEDSQSESGSAAGTPVLVRRGVVRTASVEEGGGVDLAAEGPSLTESSSVVPVDHPIQREQVHTHDNTVNADGVFKEASVNGIRSTDLEPLSLNSSHPAPPDAGDTAPQHLNATERRRRFARAKSRSVQFLLDAIQEPPDLPTPSLAHSSSLTSIDSLDATDDFSMDTIHSYIPCDSTQERTVMHTCSTQSLPIHLLPKKCHAITDDSGIVNRRRRCTAHVPRLQVARVEADSIQPTDLLCKYQFLSLGSCLGAESVPAIRAVLTAGGSNSEAFNYKLSYEREPE